MRKFLVLILTFIIVFVFTGCYSDGTIIGSLPDYESKEFYTDNTVQDFTDFGKYMFTEITDKDLEGSEYFTKIKVENIENIESYMDNFSSVIDEIKKKEPESDLVKNYNFDFDIIDENDYFHIKTREGTAHSEGTYGKFDNYSVYFIDMDSSTLYYIRCDI